jgi:hypothetical protein
VHAIDLTDLQSNGERTGPAAFDFESIDPMVFLPVRGDVAELRLDGVWTIDDRTVTLARIYQRMVTQKTARHDAEARWQAAEEWALTHEAARHDAEARWQAAEERSRVFDAQRHAATERARAYHVDRDAWRTVAEELRGKLARVPGRRVWRLLRGAARQLRAAWQALKTRSHFSS